MTWFEDLTPYSYFGGVDVTKAALNVGWLDDAHSFSTGSVPARFVSRLEVLVEHGLTRVTRGLHYCELCPPSEDTLWGDGEIRAVALDGTRFAAPSLISHYVTVHRYAPPPPFIDAVLRVPITWEEAEAKDLCISCGQAMVRTERIEGLVSGPSLQPVFAVRLPCTACGTTYSRSFPDTVSKTTAREIGSTSPILRRGAKVGEVRELNDGWHISFEPAEKANCNGMIVNKRSGKCFHLGTAFPLERDLDLYDRGYQFESYDLTILAVRDREQTLRTLGELRLTVIEEEGELTNAELSRKLEQLPCTIPGVKLYFVAEVLEKARDAGWFTFDIREHVPPS